MIGMVKGSLLTESEIGELISQIEVEVIDLVNGVRTRGVGFTTLDVVARIASRILRDEGFEVDTDWETFDDVTTEYEIRVRGGDGRE